MMKEVQIAGTAYPIKFGHTALVRMLKLAGMSKYTELEKLLNDFPAEHAPAALLALIENGLSVSDSKLKAPKLTEISAAMDNDVFLWFTVLGKLSEEFQPPEIGAEGNSVTKTSAA